MASDRTVPFGLGSYPVTDQVPASSAARRERDAPRIVENDPPTYSRPPPSAKEYTFELVSATRDGDTAPVARSTAARRPRGRPRIVVKEPPTTRRSPDTTRLRTMPLVSAWKAGRSAPVPRSNAARLRRVAVVRPSGLRTVEKSPPT